MINATRIREDFPIFRRAAGDSARHFLDSAASSQKPSVVIDAMREFLETSYANVHRGAYRLSLEATERYEQARSRVAEFIGAGSNSEIVLNRGATTGLNQVAAGWGRNRLGPDDRILVTTMEHHANLVPWQMMAKKTGTRIEAVGITPEYGLDLESLERQLDNEVAVVAVTGMSNVLGTAPPLEHIIDLAHQAGAIVVVDAAQLVTHRPIDVTTLGADFLVFSSHKMLGPTGIGVLWGRPERLEEMEPVEGGGEMISDVTIESSTWAVVPHRFEAGTPPIMEAVGFTAAIEYIDKIGMDEVERHDRELTSFALDRLIELEGLTVHGPGVGSEVDRGGVISFTLGDVHPHDLATILDSRGVAVRAGHHCAKPLIRSLGVPATARASFSVYNDEADIEALVAGLIEARRLFGI